MSKSEAAHVVTPLAFPSPAPPPSPPWLPSPSFPRWDVDAPAMYEGDGATLPPPRSTSLSRVNAELFKKPLLLSKRESKSKKAASGLTCCVCCFALTAPCFAFSSTVFFAYDLYVFFPIFNSRVMNINFISLFFYLLLENNAHL